MVDVKDHKNPDLFFVVSGELKLIMKPNRPKLDHCDEDEVLIGDWCADGR